MKEKKAFSEQFQDRLKRMNIRKLRQQTLTKRLLRGSPFGGGGDSRYELRCIVISACFHGEQTMYKRAASGQDPYDESPQNGPWPWRPSVSGFTAVSRYSPVVRGLQGPKRLNVRPNGG
jgi:hypothetical protein